MNMKTITMQTAFAAVVAVSLSLTATAANWFTDALADAEGWTGAKPVDKVVTVNGGAATYTAKAAKSITLNKVTYKTTANFVDFDAEDLVAPDGAKAALAIAEKADGSLAWFGLSDGKFVELAKVDAAGTYAVQIDVRKDDLGGHIVYSVADAKIGEGEFEPEEAPACSDFTIAGVGSVTALAGEFDQNVAVDTEKAAGRAAAAGESVEQYLETERENGLPGWVNVALDIADNKEVVAQGSVGQGGAIDFGIDKDKLKAAGCTVTQTDIEIPKAGAGSIQTVAVVVTDKNGNKTVIAGAEVGVMNPEVKAVAEGETAFQIVSVPWAGFKGEAVSLANLFQLEGLTEGDKVYVPCAEAASGYDVYKLNGDGAWEWVPENAANSLGGGFNSVRQAPAAADLMLAKGQALWVELQAGSVVVFAGAAGDTAQEIKAIAKAGEYTLIANPSIKPFNLATIEGAAEGDQLILEDAVDQREYTFADGAWSYVKYVVEEKTLGKKVVSIKTPKVVTNDTLIKPGVGFWYVRKAGAGDLTITFPKNAAE